MIDRLQELADQIAETASRLPQDDPWRDELLISSAFIQRRYLFPETAEPSPFGRISVDGSAARSGRNLIRKSFRIDRPRR